MSQSDDERRFVNAKQGLNRALRELDKVRVKLAAAKVRVTELEALYRDRQAALNRAKAELKEAQKAVS